MNIHDIPSPIINAAVQDALSYWRRRFPGYTFEETGNPILPVRHRTPDDDSWTVLDIHTIHAAARIEQYHRRNR